MAKDKIDFIGIGAAKSGTTWLTTVLRQHPEIFLSKVKEIHYFNQYRGMDHYEPNKNYEKPIQNSVFISLSPLRFTPTLPWYLPGIATLLKS